jgi:mannan polymerase II complex MNN11 subunit
MFNSKNMDPRQIDMICVQDQAGLNAGSFFIRNSDTMRMFVDLWSDPLLVDFANLNWLHQEQDLLLHLVFEHPELRKRVGWVNQTVFNSYADNRGGAAWQKGDFVVHFPDCA